MFRVFTRSANWACKKMMMSEKTSSTKEGIFPREETSPTDYPADTQICFQASQTTAPTAGPI